MGCTNADRQVAVATTSCTVAPNIYEPSVWIHYTVYTVYQDPLHNKRLYFNWFAFFSSFYCVHALLVRFCEVLL
jgi:hypothetical protein